MTLVLAIFFFKHQQKQVTMIKISGTISKIKSFYVAKETVLNNENIGRNLNRHFSETNIQMANMFMKRCSFYHF